MRYLLLPIIACTFSVSCASAQSANSRAVGYFYAPSPCELIETSGEDVVCSAVIVPLSVRYSLQSIRTNGSRATVVHRGRSDLKGQFSVSVPKGRYIVRVSNVFYSRGAGGKIPVSVRLAPARSVISLPGRLSQPVSIPLVQP